MGEPAVAVRDLVNEFRTAYDLVRALDHVSLNAQRGSRGARFPWAR